MSAKDSLSLTGRTVAGHFLVEGVVRDGRRSTVYRGQHVGPNEAVALRVFKLGGSTDPSTVDLFVKKWRAESHALSGVVLGDPQFVRTLEIGNAATGVGGFAPFAATEWLHGRSLADDVASRAAPRTLMDALALLEPAATALAFAHRSGVAHGALSTRSLFIADSDEGPQLRVLDLGMWVTLAEVGRELSLSAAESILVTPWAAAEHLDPSLGDVGLASDVYALALVVLEVLRGKPVVPADASEAEVRRIVLDPSAPRTPSALGITVGSHVEGALSRALLRDPAARWPDIGVFWNALRAALSDDDAGVPLVSTSWSEQEHDTTRRVPLVVETSEDTLTPTGKTAPTGMTPTGPTSPDASPPPLVGPGSSPTPSTSAHQKSALPDFDDGETTEMPPFSPHPDSAPGGAVLRDAQGAPVSQNSARGLVRPLDDDDLTPVQFTSSQRQRAAARVAPLSEPKLVDADAVDVTLDDTDERPMYVPPQTPAKTPAAPPATGAGAGNGKSSERRRAAKPGDPPPEVAGSGRATGLKVTKPAPSAKVPVEHLPSVIVDDSALGDARPFRESPRPFQSSTPTDDDKTVVQLEPPVRAPPARQASRAPAPAPAAARAPAPVPARLERRATPPRSLTPQPARHYSPSGRRARERRQLLLVGFVVFLAVAVATGLALGLGMFR